MRYIKKNSFINWFIQIITFFFLFFFFSCNNSKNNNESNEELNGTDIKATPESATTEKTIVFFGNSLTAGYGLEPQEAFPALLQTKLDSLGLNFEVVNAGLSGETTASGKNRVEWILKQPVDVFVLELGGNDGLRGIPLDETKKNLLEIIEVVKESKPGVTIILAGMQIPPNMGPEYTKEFQQIFPEVADKTDVHLIPFLLEGVGGEPELNLPDGIHPNEAGHKIVAENVWNVLKDVL